MPSHINHYTCLNTLGKGAFGKVKVAKAQDGSFVALKIMVLEGMDK